MYSLPGNSGIEFILQGDVIYNPGGTVTLKHAKFGNFYFSAKEVRRFKADSIKEQANRRVRGANTKKNPVEIYEAGIWALKHGQLDLFYQAVDSVLKLDPKHVDANRVIQLRQKMNVPIEDSSVQIKELKDLVPNASMKINMSKHFLLLNDTPDKPAEGHKLPRAEERLQLLEMVYESFMLTFFSRGIELEVPKERMKVVLFNQYRDYLDFATQRDPELKSATGFWDPQINVSFFYDHATDEGFVALQKLSEGIHEAANQARRDKSPAAKDLIRFANTLDLLGQVSQENEDVEVVSHEATHQLAGNTGLFPRSVRVPSWVHEGLAAYFESPNDGAWSGVGTVNKLRISFYRALEDDTEHSNVDFIVGDQIFKYAASHSSILHGYGQAWALTHFLMEKHFDKLINYYRTLGEMPPDIILSPDLLTKLFFESFPEGKDTVNLQWRSYMRSLKTDREEVLGF